MQIMKTVKRWTDDEYEYVKNNYLEMSDEEIGKYLGRSASSIKNTRSKFDLHRPKKQKPKTPRTTKLSFDEIKQIMDGRGYILLSTEDEYINQSSKMRYICSKHKDKGEQSISVYHLKNGQGCYYCGRERTNQSHKSKVTQEQDKMLCGVKGFEYIKSEIENGKAYIYFICNKHRLLGVQRMLRGNMNREIVQGCQYCANKNLPHWYVKYIIESKYPNIKVLSEYQGMNKNLICFCEKHNKKFTALAKDIYYNGSGCIECANEKRSEFQRLDLKEVEKRILEKNSEIEILNLNEYTDYESKMRLKCKKCGTIWEVPFHSFICNSGRCPSCEKGSWGEQMVSETLLNSNVFFIPQYKFDDCRGNSRPLPYDFAIFDDKNNILGLIEYHGEQHYHIVEHFGGEEKYKQRLKYDEIKTKYAKDNNIPLLIIPYWDFKDIDLLVTNYISKITN